MNITLDLEFVLLLVALAIFVIIEMTKSYDRRSHPYFKTIEIIGYLIVILLIGINVFMYLNP